LDPDPSATLIAVIKIPYNKLQSDNVLKGIVQPFELKGVNRLIRSAVKNWRSGNFFQSFLMIQSHERSIKPLTAALGFLGLLCPIKWTYQRFPCQ
jgi:hypothetical protein